MNETQKQGGHFPFVATGQTFWILSLTENQQMDGRGSSHRKVAINMKTESRDETEVGIEIDFRKLITTILSIFKSFKATTKEFV